MRYYRPIGRNGKVTRLEKLQAEYQRETRFQAEHQQETEALQMQQEVADGHVHDENCNHDHV
jgi:hypothetical protein